MLEAWSSVSFGWDSRGAVGVLLLMIVAVAGVSYGRLGYSQMLSFHRVLEIVARQWSVSLRWFSCLEWFQFSYLHWYEKCLNLLSILLMIDECLFKLYEVDPRVHSELSTFRCFYVILGHCDCLMHNTLWCLLMYLWLNSLRSTVLLLVKNIFLFS